MPQSAPIDVLDPATLKTIGQVPNMSETEIAAVIEAADNASGWGACPADERAAILSTAAQLLKERAGAIGRIITAESGKPAAEGHGEALVSAQFLQWNAEEARRTYGRTIPSPHPDRRYLTLKQPVGVVGAITPWNFPASMIARKAGAALAAGCPVVVRPATETPLCALEIETALHDAGVPREAFRVVTNEEPALAGRIFTEHPGIAKVTFTGSTDVGRLLAASASRFGKRIGLELGGHAPFIVFPDADLEKVAAGVVGSRFRNAGQSCISTNRLIVHADQATELTRMVAQRAEMLKVGAGQDPTVDLGPMIHERAALNVAALQRDALDKGARLVTGGEQVSVAGLDGFFRQPTILEAVSEDAAVMSKEVFGPLLTVSKFTTHDEALAIANATRYGLAAYVFTDSMSTAIYMAERLDFGIVGVNDIAPSAPALPFGGMKASGTGRENGPEGVEAFLELKSVSLGLSYPPPLPRAG